MSEQSTNLHLPYLMPAQAQKHVTVNESVRRLDALVQACVQSRTTRRQPDSPLDGSVYIIPPGKYGERWDGLGEQVLAYWRDGAWEIFYPRPGWTVYVRDEGIHYAYNGTDWHPLIAPKPVGGTRSLIINGTFRFWQRIQNGGTGYVADRFFLLSSEQQNSLSQERSQNVPTGQGFENSLKLTLTPQAHCRLWQVMEGVSVLMSRFKALTLSAWVKGPQGARAGFGLQGEGEDNSLEQRVLDGDWQRLTLTRLPEIGDKGLCRAVFLDRPDKAGDYFITGVQVEGGSQASPFEHGSFLDDYALCQRYFQKSYPLNTPYGSHTRKGAYAGIARGSSVGSALVHSVRFHHPMRKPPAVALYGTKGERDVWTSTAAATVAAHADNLSEAGFLLTNTAAAKAGDLHEIHWAADADFYES